MSTATTAVGSGALAALAAGTDNVAVGRQAGNAVNSGSSNVIIGAGSAPSLTTGSSNIVLGAGADVSSASVSNYLNIGGAITGNLSTGAISLSASPSSGDNSTRIATTAFVQSAVGGGSVTTTGSPSSGNLTKFSGSSSITDGDLSGDVTTSGTLATTVAKIQGTTVSGTTGSGDVVFSASPALTGNPTAPTQTSGDNSTKLATTAFVQAAVGGGGGGVIPYLSIGGLIISSIAGTHTTASFSISAGGCADLTGAAYISVSSTLSWAASNGNAINGTDASSSTLANSTTYHVFVCKGNSGTGSFVSASLTPTFPTGYSTYSRRIGSFNTTSAGAPIPYTSIESYGGATRNYLTTQVLDQGAAAVTSSARTLYTLGSIPTGVKMRPIGRWLAYGAATSQFIVTSPDETDIAPAAYTSPGTLPGWDSSINSTGGVSAMFNWDLTTNTSAEIGGRGGSTSQSFSATTRGWDDFRRS